MRGKGSIFMNSFGLLIFVKKMTEQKEFRIQSRARGVYLITEEIQTHLPKLPEQGILHLFIRHTSAGLTINENAAPSVREDFNNFMNDLVPEHWPHYTHTMEGSDDMPAHLKATIFGSSVSIPITDGRLNLGTWQGIYFGEFRNSGGDRKIIATICS